MRGFRNLRCDANPDGAGGSLRSSWVTTRTCGPRPSITTPTTWNWPSAPSRPCGPTPWRLCEACRKKLGAEAGDTLKAESRRTLTGCASTPGIWKSTPHRSGATWSRGTHDSACITAVHQGLTRIVPLPDSSLAPGPGPQAPGCNNGWAIPYPGVASRSPEPGAFSHPHNRFNQR